MFQVVTFSAIRDCRPQTEKKKRFFSFEKRNEMSNKKKKNGRRVSLDLCHRVLQSFFLHGVPDINSLSMNPPPQKKKQVKRNTFVCLEDALIARSRMPTLWGLSLKWSVSRRSLWKWPSKRKKILTKKEGGGTSSQLSTNMESVVVLHSLSLFYAVPFLHASKHVKNPKKKGPATSGNPIFFLSILLRALRKWHEKKSNK